MRLLLWLQLAWPWGALAVLEQRADLPALQAATIGDLLVALVEPEVLLYLCNNLGWCADQRRELSGVEYFAGCQRLSMALRDAGLKHVVSYDIKYDQRAMDLCSTVGYATALLLLLNIACGGIAWFAPVCSSWIWLALGSTKRRAENQWLGNQGREEVVMGNLMNVRIATMIRIAHFRGVKWFIEQPLRTYFFETPIMRETLRTIGFCRAFCWLGSWGHSMHKPSVFYASECCQWMTQLKGSRPLTSEKRGWKRSGKWISGTSDLKDSEHYPVEFCRAFAMLCVASIPQQDPGFPVPPTPMHATANI